MIPQLAPDIAGEFHLTGEQIGDLLDASAGTVEGGNGSRMRSLAHDVDTGRTPTSNPDPNIALAEAHLLTCERCAAELASLREALSLFREASSAYADNELRRRPPLAIPARTMLQPGLEPAYWVAAAAMFLAALFPLQVLRHRALPPPAIAAIVTDRPAESDEALLEDVNREISTSIPTPMQALADPIGGASSSIQTSPQTSAPRKD